MESLIQKGGEIYENIFENKQAENKPDPVLGLASFMRQII